MRYHACHWSLAMPNYVPPLHLHIAFVNTCAQGAAWAKRLSRWFMGDRDHYAVPEANIPVFVWSADAAKPPSDIPWTDAEHTALVLFIDNPFVAHWRAWALAQAASKRPGDLILVCAISPNFTNLGGIYQTCQAIRVDRIQEAEREEELMVLATHCLARWFGRSTGKRERVELFISHAKASHLGISGQELAVQLKQFILARPAGELFFDEVGISGGDDFMETLQAGLRNAVVIVLLTDRFSSRYWCGWEVMTSKVSRRPLLVVDALAEGEPLSLAFLGKSRTIRWNVGAKDSCTDVSMHRRIVAGALLELLRGEHDLLRLEAVRRTMSGNAVVEVMGRHPEIATLPMARTDGRQVIVLYPDPPLPRFELSLIRGHRPDLDLVSATQALAGSVADAAPLRKKRVAVSISASPDQGCHGLTEEHQERLWSQLATHLLAAGAELAYGGDLRKGGYTEQLLDLVRSAADAGKKLAPGVVHWYAGWPIAATLSDDDQAALPEAFELHPGHTPKELDKADGTPPANDFAPEHRFAWTLGMRDMRRLMAEACHARVMVGGQMRGVSPWPGLLEELEGSLGKPVYLVGAFGGMTRVLIRALRGESPEELTQDFQDEDGKRTLLREYYMLRAGQKGYEGVPPIDLAQRLGRLQALGKQGWQRVLNNGLSDEENERLFGTRDLTEMIALVLKGLRAKLGS
jgi:hypothetical protein